MDNLPFSKTTAPLDVAKAVNATPKVNDRMSSTNQIQFRFILQSPSRSKYAEAVRDALG